MRRNTIKYIKTVAFLAVAYVIWIIISGTFGPENVDSSGNTRDLQDQLINRNADGFQVNVQQVTRRAQRPLQVPPDTVLDHAPDEWADGLRDWVDHDRVAAELKRTGPGEQGAPVITDPSEEKAKDDLYSVNGFNGYVSDKISLDRAIPDFRVNECKDKRYGAKLLNASVVIPFHNEHWTTLLRSVHSLINRTPPELLHEIVLADDFSHKDFLGKQLEDYLAKHFGNKVRVVRAQKREGLIRARLMAAKQATGDVIVVLDSHIEANTNWLPPLIDPITRDYRTVTCPCIDIIDYDDFSLRPDHGGPGVFDWELHFKTLARSKWSMDNPAENYKSPVMVGGLFAISRQWFWELGGYDPGLDIWGGEQYELSFKLWQCGGTMYNVPCSRVAHIYRKFAPFPNPGVGDFIARNYRRVAVVWMDEYAQYMYDRMPHYKNVDPGDLTDQLAVREKLQCKPFKWFMDEVAHELLKHFPYYEPSNLAEGEIRNVESNLCMDVKYKQQGSTFGLDKCILDDPSAGGEQNLALSWRGDMRPQKRDVCLDVPNHENKAKIILYVCHNMRGNQQFNYHIETQQIYHPNSRMCIDCDAAQRELFMSACDEGKASQRWHIQTVNVTLVEQAWRDRHKPF